MIKNKRKKKKKESSAKPKKDEESQSESEQPANPEELSKEDILKIKALFAEQETEIEALKK